MKLLLLGLLSTACLTATPLMAAEYSKTDIENIVKEYIENNPEVILDSVEAYTRQQQVADAMEQQEAVAKHMDWLENNDMLPVAGNPDGDVTIIEFFDYNCGYCKKAVDDVMTLMGEDNQIKFVFIEMPILGRTSELAARWALAAKNQDAYLDYHLELMKNRGPVTESSLINIAEKINLDVEKLKKDATSDVITKQVAEKASKAAQMGITGTPAFIIDGQLYGGYIGLDAMRNAVKEARNSAEK